MKAILFLFLVPFIISICPSFALPDDDLDTIRQILLQQLAEAKLRLAAAEHKATPAENNAPKDPAKIWALLVAGSNTWDNYRHQADICHAYQILHSHGIPDEQIVVMMYDDLAYNEQNPTPGVLVNHINGSDVYHGVPKDYTGENVTPQNFLKILQGESMVGIGSGKVIQSGPNDHVFVYFSDHGAPGIVAFPEDELSATDLNNAIKKMHENNKYAKMVFYIEACESGSMFDKLLPNNINVYATTAANPDESSYACYFDEKRETYLGDEYSVNWMEDSDQEVLTQETLEKQFKIVKKETTDSHVMQYGDLNIAKLHVSEFQGRKTSSTKTKVPRVPITDAVPGPDVPLAILKRKIDKATSSEEKALLQKRLKKLIRYRNFVNMKMFAIATYLSDNENSATAYIKEKRELQNFECYDNVRAYFKQECFELSKNPYALRQLYMLVNFCENNIPVEKIREAMDVVCIHPPVHGIL